MLTIAPAQSNSIIINEKNSVCSIVTITPWNDRVGG